MAKWSPEFFAVTSLSEVPYVSLRWHSMERIQLNMNSSMVRHTQSQNTLLNALRTSFKGLALSIQPILISLTAWETLLWEWAKRIDDSDFQAWSFNNG